MRLSLTSYLLLWEAMQFSSNISSPLSLQEAMIKWLRNNMTHHLYMVPLFRHGCIKLVAILLSRIVSPPPSSMSWFLWSITCLFMLIIILCLTYICCITWLRTGEDTLMRFWVGCFTGYTTSPDITRLISMGLEPQVSRYVVCFLAFSFECSL